MTAARLYALGRRAGGTEPRRPEPTGACELDMDLLLSSGCVDVPVRRSGVRNALQRLAAWLKEWAA